MNKHLGKAEGYRLGMLDRDAAEGVARAEVLLIAASGAARGRQ